MLCYRHFLLSSYFISKYIDTHQLNSTGRCHMPFYMKGLYTSMSLHKFQSSFMFGDISQERLCFFWYLLKIMINVFSLLCETLDISGRIWQIKYVNAVFQTNIASIYNQLCLTHKSVYIIFKLKSGYTKVMFLNISAKWNWSLNLCLLYGWIASLRFTNI